MCLTDNQNDVYSTINRIARVGKWVNPFFTHDLDNSALRLIDVQLELANKFSFHTMKKKFNVLLKTLEFEFSNKTRGITGYHSHRSDCYLSMFTYFTAALNHHHENFFNWMEGYANDIIERTNAQKTWALYLKILKTAEQTHEEKVIGACFSYLATIEGFFENDMKIFYSLIEIGMGNKIAIDDLQKMDLFDIKKKIDEYDLGFLLDGCMS